MRTDRMASLRKRLQREADAFEFDALIAGVSTIEADADQDPDASAETPSAPAPPAEPTPTSGGTVVPRDAEPSLAQPAASTGEARPAKAHGERRRLSSPWAQQSLFQYGDPTGDAPDDENRAPQLGPHVAASRPDRRPVSRAADREERLRTVLDTLAGRLLLEAGRMRAAVQDDDADLAGFHLAHINQLLDILQSVDPAGDLARQLGTRAAPPPGRAWPAAAWSAVELAESPFSGLLPPSAGEEYYRQVLRAAWGASHPS